MGLAPGEIPAGNLERGKQIFQDLCSKCHTLQPSSKKDGTLYNLIGSKVGSVQDFNFDFGKYYGIKKGDVWTKQSLFNYLINPKKNMQNLQDRADLVAWIEKEGGVKK